MRIEPNDPTQSGTLLPEAIAPELILSRNEVEGLCAKAARGAGLSWGLAEEAGRAAGWLVVHGLDGADALLAELDRRATRCQAPDVARGRWRATGAAPLCPIATGSALDDFAGLEEGLAEDTALTVGPVGAPVLLLPFLVNIAEALGGAVTMRWDGGELALDGRGIVRGDVGALAAQDDAVLELFVSREAGAGRAGPAPCPVGRDTVLDLNALAMKTTVPSSEQSRADAGSAGGDND